MRSSTLEKRELTKASEMSFVIKHHSDKIIAGDNYIIGKIIDKLLVVIYYRLLTGKCKHTG